MHASYLGHWKIEVDTEDHNFVFLHSHDNRENHKAAHHDKDTEEYEGWD